MAGPRARKPLSELDVLSVAQAARAVGLSAHTVRKCCDSGDLRHHRLPTSGRDRRIRRADFLAWAGRHGLPLAWDQHQEG